MVCRPQPVVTGHSFAISTNCFRLLNLQRRLHHFCSPGCTDWTFSDVFASQKVEPDKYFLCCLPLHLFTALLVEKYGGNRVVLKTLFKKKTTLLFTEKPLQLHITAVTATVGNGLHIKMGVDTIEGNQLKVKRDWIVIQSVPGHGRLNTFYPAGNTPSDGECQIPYKNWSSLCRKN